MILGVTCNIFHLTHASYSLGSGQAVDAIDAADANVVVDGAVATVTDTAVDIVDDI